ncbi:MAG TPA: UPF0182 family protein [Armatimonadota bacterium]|nr:UPF0182 family protein [Armatimonadota bacterium]
MRRNTKGEMWNTGFRRAALITLGIFALVLVFFGSELLRLYTDWVWFTDLGYRGVFLRTTFLKFGLAVGTAILFFVVVYSNFWVTRRFAPHPSLYLDEQHLLRISLSELGRRSLNLLLPVATLVISLSVGMAAARGWYSFMLFQHPVSFHTVDPIFKRDISFYVFSLPFLHFLYRWLILALGLALFGVSGLYFFDRAIDATGGRVRIAPHARMHLCGLLGAIFLVKAGGYWLARYELLFTPQHLFFGANFTDVHVRVGAYTVLTVVAVLAALTLLFTMRTRNLRLPVAAVGVWFIVSVLGGGILPYTVQKIRVTPNELVAEQPYINHSIEATRAGFNLQRVRHRDFPAAGALKAADIRGNGDTIQNIRLWDYEPLIDAYQQIQTIRPYYVFKGADVDRYQFADGMRQVAISVRELDVNKLGAAQSSWINRHLIYTHGYGLCMSPVNRVAADGLPELLVKDLPPQGPKELKLTHPQIYCGEMTDDYVIVDSTEDEFDHPEGDQNRTTHYQGKTGVSLGSFARRLLFSLRFADQNILLSRHITKSSRILYNRSIQDRVKMLAPFLRLDGDPYPVIHNGRVVWILDAYTTSPWYPYSQRLQLTSNRYDDVINYIRNSVKVTVDAYDGTVRFYLVDPEDPIAASLGRNFPGLFLPLSKMPEDLRSHLRYPMDLFNYQARIYTGYHMSDPRVFYNREDMWEIPQLQREVSNPVGQPNSSSPMKPYYMVMKLPDS